MQTIPLQKIVSLKKEIAQLEALGKKKSGKKTAQPLSIEGLLKGANLTWKDFQEVKKIWFNEAHLLRQKHSKWLLLLILIHYFG